MNWKVSILLFFGAIASTSWADCKEVSYFLGSIDDGFALSREEALSAMEDASKFFKPHIRFDPLGEVRVDFKYGKTQEAYEEIDALGRAGHYTENRKTELLQAQETYSQQVDQYHNKLEQYEKNVSNYNRKIQEANQQHTDESFIAKLAMIRNRLAADKSSLDAEANRLRKQQQDVKSHSDELNRAIDRLNSSIRSAQDRHGQNQSFESAGLYESNARGKSITIFLYKNPRQLTALIAHEFGHALGMQHIPNDKALMNPEQTKSNENLEGLTFVDREEMLRVLGGCS